MHCFRNNPSLSLWKKRLVLWRLVIN